MDPRLNNVLFTSQLARPPHTSASFPSSPGPARPFRAHHSAFADVLGPSPALRLLASTDPDVGGSGAPLFHEAGVFVPIKAPASSPSPSVGDVIMTSNILASADMEDAFSIEVCKISLPSLDRVSGTPPGRSGIMRRSSSSPAGVEIEELVPSSADPKVLVAPGVTYHRYDLGPSLVMANGATAVGPEVIFCSQGQEMKIPKALLGDRRDPSSNWFPAALVAMDPRNPNLQPRPILNNFFGRCFNSLNDIAEHKQTGTLFFTDPDYGFQQGFKRLPQLPNAVWRLNPADGGVQMVADGLKKPNGIVFNPAGDTCYITDTDFIHGDGSMDARRPGTIYAYDVKYVNDDPPTLHSKRVFAFVDCGAPDGIKCDTNGNVYTGCFDGVHIFNSTGVLIGKILLPPDSQGQQRGCANLVFGPNGRLIILSETTVWEARLAALGDLQGVA